MKMTIKKNPLCIYIASRLSYPAPEFHMREGVHNTDIIMSYLFNLRQSMKAAARVWEKGHYPFVPGADFLLYLELDSTHPQLPYEAGKEWVRRCDAILILNGLEDSEGVKAEYELAKKEGKIIFFELDQIPDLQGHENCDFSLAEENKEISDNLKENEKNPDI